jgi:hypothetical protein
MRMQKKLKMISKMPRKVTLKRKSHHQVMVQRKYLQMIRPEVMLRSQVEVMVAIPSTFQMNLTPLLLTVKKHQIHQPLMMMLKKKKLQVMKMEVPVPVQALVLTKRRPPLIPQPLLIPVNPRPALLPQPPLIPVNPRSALPKVTRLTMKRKMMQTPAKTAMLPILPKQRVKKLKKTALNPLKVIHLM